jgi:hypothetical protein
LDMMWTTLLSAWLAGQTSKRGMICGKAILVCNCLPAQNPSATMVGGFRMRL